MNNEKTDFLNRDGFPSLAFVQTLPSPEGCVSLPFVMFLGGYASDMEGTKALYLEEQCRARGQGFVRFDYSGHGSSGGDFNDGTIGIWKDDALAVFDKKTSGSVVLVGSSMGGWISLLLAQERPERAAGLVGIAAAPDFTRVIKAEMTEEQHIEMAQQGYVEVPNDYSDEPYVFTKALIDDGEKRCFLDRTDNRFSCPLRLVQGMKDTDVPWQTAFRLKNTIPDGDVEVHLVEEGDHRLSREEDLALIDAQVRLLSGLE